MEEIFLVLFLKEEAYGKRLLRFLAGKKNPRLHLELITEKEEISVRIQEENVVVLTDDISLKEVDKSEDEIRKILYLTTEQSRKEGKIYQYQKAEDIYVELLELLGVEKEEPVSEESGTPPGIYGVFSQEGKERTEYAVKLSQYLGKQGKTLYLCLSGFPLYFQEDRKAPSDFSEQGLSELMFLVLEEEFPDKEREWSKPFGEAECILPWKHFKDLWDISVPEWETFFRRLKEECKYIYIVVEIGELFENVFEVMDFCDKIFFLTAEGISGQRQKEVFQRYCEMEQKKELEMRIEYMECNEKNSEGEGENDCILEGFE